MTEIERFISEHEGHRGALFIIATDERRIEVGICNDCGERCESRQDSSASGSM